MSLPQLESSTLALKPAIPISNQLHSDASAGGVVNKRGSKQSTSSSALDLGAAGAQELGEVRASSLSALSTAIAILRK